MEANSRALQKQSGPQVLRLQRSRKIFAWNHIPTETGSKRVFGDISKNSCSIVLGADDKPQEAEVQWEVRK